jgi:hypothetical protein
MVSRKSAAALYSGLAALLFFLVASLALPVTKNLPSSTSAEERETNAKQFVGRALRVWQERLNLTDWDVRVQLVHPNKLEPKTLGNIHWDTNTKKATIDVLSSYDYTLPVPEMLDDMELTVVHELVHLHLAILPRTEATRRNEEYVVNQISRALLNLSKR